MPLNILTFNWHGPYICLLAKTGYLFEVVLRLKGGRKEWLVEQRPVPENIILISEEHALRKCYCHFYDIIICQNIDDLLLVKNLGWKPDVFLYIDTGISYPLINLDAIKCSKFCQSFKKEEKLNGNMCM